MILISVCGARPNFMKIAPIAHELDRSASDIKHIIVHTGQHYDKNMSGSFFEELNIPEPDVNLSVGSGSHAVQTGKIMEGFENYLLENEYEERDDAKIMVVGDVNSTMACAIVAKKLHLHVIHYEAGLRSFDRRMPEEINRLATDAVCDEFFVTDEAAITNLQNEGQPEERIHHVGNLMIDTLYANKDKAEATGLYKELGLEDNGYALMTMHRPSNVDHKDVLTGIVHSLKTVSEWCPIIFPMHPRTRKNLEDFGLWGTFSALPGMQVIEPLGYHDLLNLQLHCRMVLTDSGGIQEESTALLKPCLTMRDTTERPCTLDPGCSVLVGNDPEKILKYTNQVKEGTFKAGAQIPLWDGTAAVRIVNLLKNSQ